MTGERESLRGREGSIEGVKEIFREGRRSELGMEERDEGERGREGRGGRKKNNPKKEQRQRDEPPNSALWHKTHYTRAIDTVRAVR